MAALMPAEIELLWSLCVKIKLPAKVNLRRKGVYIRFEANLTGVNVETGDVD